MNNSIYLIPPGVILGRMYDLQGRLIKVRVKSAGFISWQNVTVKNQA